MSSLGLRLCGEFSVRVVMVVLVAMTTSVEGNMMDLTHKLNNKSQHFQLFKDFEMKSAMKGNQARLGGMWVEANNLMFNEHTGTHVDAPVHTWQTGIHMDEVPLKDLVGPAIVISVREQAKTNRDYLLTIEDVLDFEMKYGRIPDGSIILLDTGGADVYWTPSDYLGTQTIKVVSSMHFPGFSGPIIEWLVDERYIKGLGVDRISFDAGQNNGHPAHIALLSRGKFGIENMNNLKKLPPVGSTIVVAALPIEGGSGAPARIVAFWDTDLPGLSSTTELYPRVCAMVVAFVITAVLCI